eukprot:gb/GECG01011357.1/.p1 GENE.gb/GECG01011357.1/~~gb/GECG01011357.1/.p1  ORF type:complete len:225 (+),score=22.14 gb/GECG01011357.1/:1-675(+)
MGCNSSTAATSGVGLSTLDKSYGRRQRDRKQYVVELKPVVHQVVLLGAERVGKSTLMHRMETESRKCQPALSPEHDNPRSEDSFSHGVSTVIDDDDPPGGENEDEHYHASPRERNQFDEYHPTIGMDLCQLKCRQGGAYHKINVWDTSGNPRFFTVAEMCLRMSTAVILVFDVTNRASFDAIKDEWLPQVNKVSRPGAKLALFGISSNHFLLAVCFGSPWFCCE